MRLWSSLLLLICLFSCNEDDPTTTELLTSTTWDKPEVLHHPSFGVYATTTCSESYEFTADGGYRFTNYCNPVTIIDGTWTWTKVGEEIKLETKVGGIPQKTFRILILQLTETTLHTKQMEESEPLTTSDFWELKYKPR